MITQKIIARTDSLKLDKIISRYGEDSMRQVVFIIVRPDPESDKLIPITIPEDAVGSFRILKPSGNFVIVPMSKSVLATGETAFDVVLPASVNTAKGSGYYDIRITSDTDKYYFTAQGDFLIDDNIISDEVLEDVSEVNGLVFPDDFITVDDHVAIIDDDTLSTDSTWSSDKISEEIESHAGGDVSKTVSGNPVTFEDGADAPLVKCVTQITGSQDLHGYDKPWVGGAEKNKLPMTVSGIKAVNTSGTWSNNTYSYNGITFLIMTDNSGNVTGVKVESGTASSTAVFMVGKVTIERNGQYILNGCPSGGSTSNYVLANWAFNFDGGNGTALTVNDDANNGTIRIRINNGYSIPTGGLIFYPQVRLANVEDSSFTPYSNICPITAYTEGEIEVRGKNLFDKNATDKATGYYLNYNTGGVNPSAAWGISGYIKCDPNTTYAISGQVSLAPSNYEVCFYDETKTFISGINQNDMSFTTPNNDDVYYLRFDYKIVDIDGIQLEKGSTATTYEPYTSTTHTTTYPSAIYRGSEDVVNGEVTGDWIAFDIGSLTWTTRYTGTIKKTLSATPQQNYKKPFNGICENYEVIGSVTTGSYFQNPDSLDYGFYYFQNAQYPDSYSFYVVIGVNDSVGGNCAYELATPTTTTVTPTNLPIKSLFGYNHIESSTGEMEVEYIIQRYQPLIDSIKQL